MKNKLQFFEGWYFKQQSKRETLVFIPGRYRGADGSTGAFVQVILQGKSYYIPYSAREFIYIDQPFQVQVGSNVFREDRVHISIDHPQLKLSGVLEYGKWTKLKYDIMGPFAMLPGMQCRHGIMSMRHTVDGTLMVQGEEVSFDNSLGYAERDEGSSFPDKYLWTQCNWRSGKNCSVMTAIAAVPYMGIKFKGCIAVVHYDGKEYRFATYLGAVVKNRQGGKFLIKQGIYKLFVNIKSGKGNDLKAPKSGCMSREIKECIDCYGRYRFVIGDKVIFDLKSDRALYEYVE